jgi:hypothetical protein
MTRPLTIDLFVEDHAHEALLKPLLNRVCDEQKVVPDVRVRSARGGHPRVLAELKSYLTLIARGGVEMPDLLVVAKDANCERYATARKAVLEVVESGLHSPMAVACPDPHIERWYMLDPASFKQVVGAAPVLRRRKCERAYYKHELAEAVTSAGFPPLLGGIEFAPELAREMNLEHAAADPSFHQFLQDFRSGLKVVARKS